MKVKAREAWVVTIFFNTLRFLLGHSEEVDPAGFGDADFSDFDLEHVDLEFTVWRNPNYEAEVVRQTYATQPRAKWIMAMGDQREYSWW